MRDAAQSIQERFRRARTASASEEGGWTLVELIISMTIFVVLLVIVFTMLITYSIQTKDTLARNRSVDQAQLGLMQLDRQVRSGNVISDPANETSAASGVPPYYSLRVYTQTDGVFQCVQWRVRFPSSSTTGLLEFRSWKPGSVASATDWRVTAHDVVRPTGTTITSDPTTWPPFFVEATQAETSSQAQTIRVTLRLKDPLQSARSKPATVTSTLTGRNTIFGYPSDSCGVTPAP